MPDVATLPLQLPDAVQAVVLLEDQVRTEDWPAVMLAGASAMLTVGVAAAAVMVTATLFSTPPQVSA